MVLMMLLMMMGRRWRILRGDVLAGYPAFLEYGAWRNCLSPDLKTHQYDLRPQADTQW